MKTRSWSVALIALVLSTVAVADPAPGPGIDVAPPSVRPLNVGVQRQRPAANSRFSNPGVMIHAPTSYRSMGTHQSFNADTPVQRHRVSCGLNVCLDIQARVAF